MTENAKFNPAWLLAAFLALILAVSGYFAARTLFHRPGAGPDGDTVTVTASGNEPAAATPAVSGLPELVAQRFAADAERLPVVLAAARSAFAAQQYAAAEAAYREAVALSNWDTVTQEAFARLGDIYYDLAQFTNAAFCYRLTMDERLTGTVGWDDTVQHNLALAELQRGNLAAARTAAHSALALRVTDGGHYALLAVVAERLSDIEAETIARKAVALDTDNALARVNYAILALRRNYYDTALLQLQQALALNPAPAVRRRALAELAQARLMRGTPKEALPVYEQALADDPDDPVLLHNYGLALLRAGEAEAAVVQLRRATAMPPVSPPTCYLLGRALGATNNSGLAGEAIRAYQRGIEADPRNVAQYCRLGKLFYDNRDYGSARLTFAQVLELDRESLYATTAHRYLAVIAYGQADYAEALTQIAAALSLGHNQRELQFDRGLIRCRAGDTEAGLQDLQEVQHEAPGKVTLQAYASTLLRAGRYVEALAPLQTLTGLDTGDATWPGLLGRVQQQRHDLPAAATAYTTALQRPANRTWQYRINVNLAAVHAGLRHWTEAERCLRQAAAVEPDRWESYYQTALTAAAQGRSDAALAAVRVALEKEPLAARSHAAHGWLLWEKGLRAEAATAWERAVELDPTMLDALYNIDYYRRQAASAGEE